MRRLIKVMIAFAAVAALTVYFFDEFELVSRPEMMTWEEFAKNPSSVAKFREKEEFLRAAGVSPERSLEAAYEHYINESAGGRAMRGAHSEWLQGFRSMMHGLYRTFGHGSGNRKRSAWLRIDSAVGRDRLGMTVTLALLLAAITGLSLAVRAVEKKTRV